MHELDRTPPGAIDSRGHLNPGDAEVVFRRFSLGLDDLVRHVWMAWWNVPAGEVRPQRVLTYPACNAVFLPESAILHGPKRGLYVQRLWGRGWVVGVMFQAAAGPLLTRTPPVKLPEAGEQLPESPHAAIIDAMEEGVVNAPTIEIVTVLLTSWLEPLAARVDAAGRMANSACRLVEESGDILRVAELAARLDVAPRTLGRCLRRQLGVSPKWLIERRRLQLAATTLYREPKTDLADLAAELGFTDQAHFTRRYRSVLCETPGQTRKAALRHRAGG